MPSDQFPRFVAGRIAHTNEFQQEKTKHAKAKSLWWNVYLVAMKARGNRIGSITDLKTSCLAAGKPQLAYKLVEQLQNALDSLKHKVEIHESVISDIRKEAFPVLIALSQGSSATLRPLLLGSNFRFTVRKIRDHGR